MTETGTPGYLTVREAAAEMGRTPETIRRWVWSGRIPARKRGNRLVVSRDDLDRAAGTASTLSLAAWHGRLTAKRSQDTRPPGLSAADLVLDDRGRRSSDGRRARR